MPELTFQICYFGAFHRIIIHLFVYDFGIFSPLFMNTGNLWLNA